MFIYILVVLRARKITRITAAESSSRRRSRIAAASPDDDWGWYVVGGCAFANFLLPGMLGSFGPDVLDGFAGIYEIKSKNGFVSRWISTTFNLTFAVAGM